MAKSFDILKVRSPPYDYEMTEVSINVTKPRINTQIDQSTPGLSLIDKDPKKYSVKENTPYIT